MTTNLSARPLEPPRALTRTDITSALRYAALLSVLAIVASVSPSLRTAILIGAALWTLRGPVQSVQALTLSWFVAFLNPGLGGYLSSLDTTLRWLILALAAGRALVHYSIHRCSMPPALRRALLFVLSMLSLTPVIAYSPEIASLKLIAFATGLVAVLGAMDQAAEADHVLESWFAGLFLALLLASIPLVFSPIGFLRNGRSFQGVLNHPQALGIVLAVAVSWFYWRSWSRFWPRLLGALLTVSGLAMLVASQARTAALALVGAALLVLLLLRRTDELAVKRARIFAIFLAVLLSVALLPDVERRISSFATKSQHQIALQEAFGHSRGVVLERGLRNIREHPFFGIGFGLPSSPLLLNPVSSDVLDIPISASSEKGFAAIAVLEETGIVGASLILWVLAATVLPVIRSGVPASAAVLFSSLLVNFGESVLFSFGGMGLFFWLMIGWAGAGKR